MTRLISKLFFRIKIYGKNHIPPSGGFIVATNHISYFDPPLVGSWMTRQVYFFAKKELFKNKIFGWIITRTNALPVRRGSIDRHTLEAAVAIIKKGYGLTIFPEGTRSKTNQFLEPKPGVGIIAIRARCPIIPGYIHGANRLKDCFRGREKFSITFGEPFSSEWVTSFPDNKDSYYKIAHSVMERIAQIKQKLEN
ncbi:MAG: 1-acyl-sn-glycerol-3-phosphate acyltransferase [FCB group bacterium]|nr:1-acyl-sn-glycerol-3-phosphate acyltransferase [FCB group bacterium]